MKTFEISNEFLNVTLSDFGGEMTSVRFLGVERLWNGNPEFWKRHAPFLFPIVGSLKGGKTVISGKEYFMEQHGLSRVFTHDVVEKSDSSITFYFASSEETLKSYPYEFEFFTKYTLIGKKLEIIITIKNKGEKELLCSVGGHPAFVTTLYDGDTFDNYEIVFEKEEKALERLLIKDALYYKKESCDAIKVVPICEKSLNGTIIFSGFESEYVSLIRKGTGEKVSAYLGGHTLIAFWKGEGAPFICLEPWNGIADPYEFSGKFEEKPFMEKIDDEKEYDFSLIFE